MTSEASNIRFTPNLVTFLNQKSDELVRDKEAVKHPWYQNHFEKTKTAINNAFQNLNNTTALILGVGAAQDIDLKTLAKTFEKIRLVDIDLSQTKKAILEQIPEEELRAKFELEEADLTGIFPELCIETEKLMDQNDLTYNEFVDKILDLLPTLKPTTFPYQRTESSFVCSSLIGTQLVGTLAGYLNELTQKKYSEAFKAPENREKEFDSFLTHVIENHLHELRSLVSPSGQIYYADHFTLKGIVHIHHPETVELEDAIQELGEEGFPFTESLGELIQKIFTVVSQQKWEWALPVKYSRIWARMTNEDGTVQKIPADITEFREYQISSYVLDRPKTGY